VTVEIRRASPADEDALRTLDRANWSTLSSPVPVPPPERLFFNDRTGADDVLVALVEGELAGYVKVAPPTDAASNAHVQMVHGITVDGAFRRRGVGRALVDAAVAEARARGARRLTLRVLSHNEAALALYESAGFVVEGVQHEEFLLDGRYVDDLLMALDLQRDRENASEPLARSAQSRWQ
jgi:ribosomal protein S18 acetylase RimI-like enzyme